jgi:multiphosphoryl transfer protein
VIGLVIVSHSEGLAAGVVELAREMGGTDVPIEAAGGLEDGSVGTDAERVRAAIERAMSDDGVLVLMDLGSALMSAEMAAELLEGEGRVLLSEAPLVEGAVAAAAAARGGASLDEVAAEARGALAMKASQLGAAEPAEGAAAEPVAAEADAQARVPVLNEIGLHARPAALVVELAGRFDADLRLAKDGGAGPVNARSLTGLMTLAARRGDTLLATASGPEATDAIAALEELAGTGFGEGVPGGAAAEGEVPDAAAPPGAAPGTASAAAATAAPSPPGPGTRLTGIAASPGIAIGPARLLRGAAGPPPERPADDVAAELGRLEQAIGAARAAISADRERIAERGAAGDAAIFAAHLALLDDEALVEPARAAIEGGAPAERAWYDAAQAAAATYRGLDDPLLRERAADVQDVGRRVVEAIRGDERREAVAEDGVVVTDELTPADAAALDPQVVRGVATARGAATAHAAILARALGLPAVVGLGDAVLAVPGGTPLLLDGDEGTLHVAPGEEVAAAAHERAERVATRRRLARERVHEPARTRDGERIEVAANIGGPAEVAGAVELGAEGVGLLRTEFLFLDRPSLPSEDEQVEVLAEVARGLDGRPLIVRTLDAGADKPLPALPMEPEANPFLGRRGIRLSLERPDLLSTQLRAILRVASRHPLRVMFPMVATTNEVLAALELLAQARAEAGVEAPLDTGIMVEVPAAALLARQLALHVDFFSIGTNDLTQYTMAAERGNERVASLLAGPQPAVLRLVRETVAGARAHGRWVGVCGELAGDPAAAVLLAGLGVRELSMAPPLIPEAKAALREITMGEAKELAERALEAPDAAEARRPVQALL